MVVIEPISSDSSAKQTEKISNTQREPAAEKSPPELNTRASTAATEEASSGYNSDGYETASEADLNDADEQQTNGTNDNVKADVTSNGDADSNKAAPEQSVSESTPDESEVKENALARANDAKFEGNTLFKDGLYEEALSKYELALGVVLDDPSFAEIRSVCHANRAACLSKMGKCEDTIKECTKALELNPKYIKALLRRAEAREKLEQYEEAISDMTKVLELEPSNEQARRAIVRLKPLADEKREKMKEEMIGKLKEMGNSILGRFGMSVDNFKAVKDPNTGSYSISFQN